MCRYGYRRRHIGLRLQTGADRSGWAALPASSFGRRPGHRRDWKEGPTCAKDRLGSAMSRTTLGSGWSGTIRHSAHTATGSRSQAVEADVIIESQVSKGRPDPGCVIRVALPGLSNTDQLGLEWNSRWGANLAASRLVHRGRDGAAPALAGRRRSR